MSDMNVWMAIVAVAVVVALVLIWLGYHLALDRMRDTHAFIARQQAAMDAEWWRLDQTRRIRSVFWAARQAMQHEADNHLWSPVADTTYRNADGSRNENREGTR
jgi:hypothetical protein